MHKFERLGLWALAIVVALFTAINFGSIGTLEETVAQHTATLAKPVVQASVIPGVPNALKDPWTKATAEADGAIADQGVWLTVRITNQGHGEAGYVVSDLAFASPIKGIFAYSADGDVLGGNSYAGPEVAEGGTGKQNAKIEFDDLPVAKSHLVFVELEPTTVSGLVPAAGGNGSATAMANGYWDSVSVTSAEDRWEDEKTTAIIYGPGRVSGASQAVDTKTADKTSG